MQYKIWINLARITWDEESDLKTFFFAGINQCHTLWISVIRIFFVDWSLPFSDFIKKKDFICELIKECERKNISLIFVLNHFTDFTRNHKREFGKSTNTYIKNKINEDDMISAINFLSLLTEDLKIEIFNEIDLIDYNIRGRIINSINKIYLGTCLTIREKLSVSISNHLLYYRYKRKLLPSVDIHTYSFPYDCMLSNINFCLNNQINFIGEYAKFSDEPYIDNYDSLIYFTAWLWWGYINNMPISPLHRWWDSILFNKYIDRIISIFKNTAQQFNYLRISNVNIVIYTRKNNISCFTRSNIKKKFYSRLKDIFDMPFTIMNEINSIIKYTFKLLVWRQSYAYSTFKYKDQTLVFLETYIQIESITLGNINYDIEVRNLITGENICYNSIITLLNPWFYLIIYKNET